VVYFQGSEGLRLLEDVSHSVQTGSGAQASMKWVPGALSLGVKRSGREVNQLPPPNPEVKNSWRYAWSYASIRPIRLHGVVLSYSTGITLPLPGEPPVEGYCKVNEARKLLLY
jgi:hypothetical protein